MANKYNIPVYCSFGHTLFNPYDIIKELKSDLIPSSYKRAVSVFKIMDVERPKK